MAKRYICIHGHFYQPPRESPWLEAVEPEDSAAPFSDWNERICRECYSPNGVSRIRESSGRIIRISNNYREISFNFGPTLLSWIAAHSPDTLHTIVDGDRQSRERLDGHGNAMAQVYNHVIMPLASPRDRCTQLLWGVADFRARFGRDPEGMWLPEAAVDTATLEELARLGIRFTVLAPRQARRWRPIGDPDWTTSVDEAIDPRRAYRARLPSGRDIALFFYDGALAHGIAFGSLLDDGNRFAEALLGGFRDDDDEAQLVNVATDGESYGHHHRFGDMALAYALDRLRRSGDAEISNYGSFLAAHPPTWEVEIHDRSSWSCAHGVERWRSDCGCNAGTPKWHQRWRAPLRTSLEQLKSELDTLFQAEGARWLQDPWAARDDYVQVVLDRSPENIDSFLAHHLRPEPGGEARRQALTLLEMQRHGMLMFTSCGWFFDELSGLEGTQILKYAARALQLAAPHRPALESTFLEGLSQAESNIPTFRDGRGIWTKLIAPARVELERVIAHVATSAVLGEAPTGEPVYAFDAALLEQAYDERGDSHLGVGQLRVTSRLTLQRCEAAFAVLHFGGLDMHAWVRPGMSRTRLGTLTEEVQRLFRDASIADVYDRLRTEFGGDSFKLQDLFTREQRRLISGLFAERLETYRSVLAGLAAADRALIERVRRLGHPLPPTVALATEIAFEQELLELLDQPDDGAVAQIREQADRGEQLPPHRTQAVVRAVEDHLVDAIRAARRVEEPERISHALNLLEVARVLELRLDLWEAQNALLQAPRPELAAAPAGAALITLAEQLDLDPDLLRSPVEPEVFDRG